MTNYNSIEDIEVKKGHWAVARVPGRKSLIEGRVSHVTRDGMVVFDHGEMAPLTSIEYSLGPMRIGRGGLVEQNPLVRVRVTSPSQRPHRSSATGKLTTSPSGRLRARRKKTAAGPKRFYANPAKDFPYRVAAATKREGPFLTVAHFRLHIDAENYAKAYHRSQPKLFIGLYDTRRNSSGGKK